MNWKYLIPIIAILTVGSLYLMMDNADESDAATGTYTDGDWTFNVVDGNATIVSNTATGITNLVIPSTVSDGTNTYNVTVVGGSTDAIIQNSQLSSGATLTIPDSVTSIELGAFSNCISLTSVTIGDSVTTIGASAFNSCSGLTSLDLGEGVQTIGSNTFKSCTSLTSVVIPDSVTSIGKYAFFGCLGLTSLDLGDGVQTIGQSAFYDCSGLTGTLTIPDSVTSIGNNAFQNCSGLTSLDLGDGVQTIGQSAFKGCAGVTTLIIEGSPTTIGTDAFKMDNLEKVINLGTSSIGAGSYGIPSTTVVVKQDYPQDGSWLYSVSGSDATIIAKVGKDFASVEIPSTVTDSTNTYNVKIVGNGTDNQGGNVVRNAQLSSGATLTIPNGVTSIGKSAFYGCSGLTGTLTIPDSVTSIGTSAFQYCSGLTSLALGEGVTSIGYSTFQGCTSLTSVIIPNSMTSIGSYAFKGCAGVTSLTMPDSVTSIGSDAFYGCSGVTTLIVEGSPTSIGSNAFKMDNLTKLGNFGTNTSIVAGAYGIPNNVEILSVWYGYTLDSDNNATLYKILGDFNGLTVPSTLDGYTVTAIGNGSDAIIKNSQIASDSALTIPNGITAINGNAFKDCANLTGMLVIPDSVTSIGNGAFDGCSGFTGTLTIPISVISIGTGAFDGCSGFDSLINLSSATFGTNSLNMAGVTEVLNLGDTELNPGSYGLPSTCTVKTEIDADSYIAPASIKESHDKEGAVYTILALLPLFIILGALVVCATTIVRKN